jgi:hypothetical protein
LHQKDEEIKTCLSFSNLTYEEIIKYTNIKISLSSDKQNAIIGFLPIENVKETMKTA